MKTAYYTFITWKDRAMAAGFDSGLGEDRGSVLIRQREEKTCASSGDKVVDLSAWRTTNLDEFPEDPAWEGDESEWEAETPEGLLPPAIRSRKSRRSMLTAELVSTLCVVAVAVVLIVRVLTF